MRLRNRVRARSQPVCIMMDVVHAIGAKTPPPGERSRDVTVDDATQEEHP
jgi:hypothetical protein